MAILKEIQTALKAKGINKKIAEIDEFLQKYHIDTESFTLENVANLIEKLLLEEKQRSAKIQTNDEALDAINIQAILRADLLREYIKLLDLWQIEEVENLVKKQLIQKLQRK